MNIGKQVLPGVTGFPEVENQGKWMPAALIGLYFLIIWLPPDLMPVHAIRWYMALGVAALVFLLEKRMVDRRAAGLFFVVLGLNFFGAVLSLWRAPDFSLALRNTVAFAINIVFYLLLIPVMSTRLARKVLLAVLVGASLLWVIIINQLIQSYGTLGYGTFPEVTGADKNAIGYRLTLGSIILLYLVAFWKSPKQLPPSMVFLIRLIMGLGGLYFIYSVSLIYARSALVMALLGVGIILLRLFISSPKKSRILRIGAATLIVSLSVIWFLPKVLSISPSWYRMSNDLQTEGVFAFTIRLTLLGKGLYLIRQNPFLGVGIGGSKASISSFEANFPHYFIHNTYISEWAEKGLLGILGYLIWFILYLKFIRKNFLDLPVTDQIWLLLIFLVFFNLNFLDINSTAYLMFIIFIGIYAEQYKTD